MTDPQTLAAAARNSKAWPFEEAKRLAKRFADGDPGRPVVFETGYGPSGLPHIGTFTEVLRTTMVRRAFEALMGWRPEDGKTRLIAFSDDMDGLRKVPDNVPNPELLADNLGKPLSRIPNPFDSEHDSFAAHNNALLQRFLDRYGFDYEFAAASDKYNSGAFDEALRTVLRRNQAILDIMLPTLREERRATYSPILPISPATGRVLQVPVEILDADSGMIAFTDEDGSRVEQSALGGRSKCQWKVDWAMRWVALGVDYEMYGKDLTDSGVQSGRIAKVLGGRKPEGLIYEMFLDEKGEKISKSKGNGLSIEDWLTYGSEESLAFYIYREPRKAKNLHLGLVPRAVDEYWQFRGNYPEQPLDKKLGNPVHHIHNGAVPDKALPLTYGLLLNLVSLPGLQDKAVAWKFVNRYAPGATPESDPELDRLIGLAVNYARDFVVPGLQRRAPVGHEVDALRKLDEQLAALDPGTPAEDIQNIVFEVGKAFPFESLRHWFQALYETLLGSPQGPRMGSFIALYGIAETRKLIAEALAAAA
ncbi:lysine--tRNA ligase [Sphingomicrobium astaxanthinifaciens]|uniref:lysine--tRNA ligase n=1 Tax=Sphingomicrobium astaxanthinifaciens TaxID=1227949 RepID=UPI001FCB4960|nr:lysine--tRNA ligase [Sphingomicrobium astaxanthinifaciens]MCJ7420923.1 lysine--tRNA ligase [Sphingomicrobium astaxanthinifaciens]